MAGGAEGDEVIEPVGELVEVVLAGHIAECTEGCDVVYIVPATI
jgi:hypothetical protein